MSLDHATCGFASSWIQSMASRGRYHENIFFYVLIFQKFCIFTVPVIWYAFLAPFHPSLILNETKSSVISFRSCDTFNSFNPLLLIVGLLWNIFMIAVLVIFECFIYEETSGSSSKRKYYKISCVLGHVGYVFISFASFSHISHPVLEYCYGSSISTVLYFLSLVFGLAILFVDLCITITLAPVKSLVNSRWGMGHTVGQLI